MPDVIKVNDVAQYDDKEVTLRGWLYNKRSSGKLRFRFLYNFGPGAQK